MKTGRNDRCPCGSGKKYKTCCAVPESRAQFAKTQMPLGISALAPGPTTASRLVALTTSGRFADMESLASELVTMQPESGFAWKALSVAQQMQHKSALPALERAALLLPDDPEAQSNLGAELRRAGRPAEALRSCRRALEINPAIAEVWNNLGNALNDLGQFEEAASAFGKALALKPRFAKPHNNLGNALRDLGELDQAAASYQHALSLEPNYTEAENNLGIVRRLQSRTAEAEVHCRRALELDPHSAAALLLRAELQSDQGDFTAAERSFRRAAAIEPGSPEAWAGIAGLRRMTAADADWYAEATRMVAQPLAPRRELHLRFAMGKYLDDLGDYARAFETYRRANELAKIGRPIYDPEQLTLGIDRLIECVDQEWLNRAHEGANRSERPVFVIGMPRSGTTLAAQIIASHPMAAGAGELPFWSTAATKYIARDTSGANTLGRLALEYLTQLQHLSPDARRIVDKMPANFLYVGVIHAALPNARFIHLRRDPLDTCLSVYFQNFSAAHSYANDLEDLRHYYAGYERIMRHWRRVLPPQVMLEVRYEELVETPEEWSRYMVEFVGLPWEASCLEFYQSRGNVSTFSKWQVRQRINKSSVARWRNYAPFLGPLLSPQLPIDCREVHDIERLLHQP